MLINTIDLSLHSSDAQRLFNGGDRTKQFIPSFLYTQRRLNTLFSMAMNENPYAEAALIELDIRLEEVKALTDLIIKKAKHELERAKHDGITVHLLKNKKPMITTIEFSSEYSNELAKMMTIVDLAFRHIRSAHSSGYLNTELAEDQIKSLSRKVRMVFDRINGYAKKIQPGVTRKDIENKTAKAKSMIEKFGRPNDDILTRKVSFNVKRISELAE